MNSWFEAKTGVFYVHLTTVVQVLVNSYSARLKNEFCSFTTGVNTRGAVANPKFSALN